jgi:hypothetical protein
VVVSIEGRNDAAETQNKFPHLVVVADKERQLTSAVDLIHHSAGPHGEDAVFPTTILIDHRGMVRWLYRPESYLRRLSPEELLAQLDKHLSAADLSPTTGISPRLHGKLDDAGNSLAAPQVAVATDR